MTLTLSGYCKSRKYDAVFRLNDILKICAVTFPYCNDVHMVPKRIILIPNPTYQTLYSRLIISLLLRKEVSTNLSTAAMLSFGWVHIVTMCKVIECNKHHAQSA